MMVNSRCVWLAQVSCLCIVFVCAGVCCAGRCVVVAWDGGVVQGGGEACMECWR